MSTYTVHDCFKCGKHELVDGTNHNWHVVNGELICQSCWEKGIFSVPNPVQIRWS